MSQCSLKPADRRLYGAKKSSDIGSEHRRPCTSCVCNNTVHGDETWNESREQLIRFAIRSLWILLNLKQFQFIKTKVSCIKLQTSRRPISSVNSSKRLSRLCCEAFDPQIIGVKCARGVRRLSLEGHLLASQGRRSCLHPSGRHRAAAAAFLKTVSR